MKRRICSCRLTENQYLTRRCAFARGRFAAGLGGVRRCFKAGAVSLRSGMILLI